MAAKDIGIGSIEGVETKELVHARQKKYDQHLSTIDSNRNGKQSSTYKKSILQGKKLPESYQTQYRCYIDAAGGQTEFLLLYLLPNKLTIDP